MKTEFNLQMELERIVGCSRRDISIKSCRSEKDQDSSGHKSWCNPLKRPPARGYSADDVLRTRDIKISSDEKYYQQHDHHLSIAHSPNVFPPIDILDIQNSDVLSPGLRHSSYCLNESAGLDNQVVELRSTTLQSDALSSPEFNAGNENSRLPCY